LAENDLNLNRPDEAGAFDRRFKYAVIALAIIEFIVIVSTVYYKVTR
jgi:hypothetical protein